MTGDTTTIEITEDQRDELKALKAHERESYKSVIGRLLESTDADATPDIPDPGDVLDWDGMAAAYRETEEGKELLEQLDRIERAAATAEERTGSIQHTLENMSGR